LKALVSALLFLAGLAIGIAVDRDRFRAPSPPPQSTEAPSVMEEEDVSGTPVVAPEPSTLASAPAARATTITLEEAEQSIEDLLGSARSSQRLCRIEQVCSLIDPEDIPDALRRMDRLLRRQPEWDTALRALAARWVESDPDGALSRAEELKGDVQVPFLFGVVEGLARHNPRAAKEFLLSMSPWSWSIRNGLTKHFVEVWAGYDLASALEWMQELPDGGMKAFVIQGLVEPWSRSDPRAAAEFFQGIPGQNRNFVPHIAAVWALQDPSAASAWAMRLPPGEARSGVVQTIISVWAERDPRAAAAFLSSESTGLLPWVRANAIGTVARAWVKEDLGEAASWFQDLPPELASPEAARAISGGLAETSPEAAADLILTLPDGSARNSSVADLARLWAQRDIEGVLAWTELLSGEDKETALMIAVPAWAEADLPAALAHARELAPGETRSSFLAALLPAVAFRDPEKAALLCEELPEASLREGLALQVVTQWLQVSPAGAARWAETFPEGDLRARALRAVVGSLGSYDPSAAESWLSSLPPGGSLQAAVSAFVDGMSSQDPGKAAEWALRLEDPSEQTIKLESVGRAWLTIDPARARVWIASSSLPDAMKTQLLDPAK